KTWLFRLWQPLFAGRVYGVADVDRGGVLWLGHRQHVAVYIAPVGFRPGDQFRTVRGHASGRDGTGDLLHRGAGPFARDDAVRWDETRTARRLELRRGDASGGDADCC